MALTETQFILLVWMVFAVVVVGLVMAFWISRKYPKKAGKMDPVYKGVVLFVFLFLLYLAMAALGFRTKDEVRSDLKWWVVAGIAFVLFYSVVSYYTKKPISAHKLWEYYVLPDVRKFWDAEPYIGSAYINGMMFHKEIEIRGKEKDGKLHVFLGQVMAPNLKMFLSIRNKYTGEDVEMIIQPLLNLRIIHDLVGKEVASSVEKLFQEYDTPEKEVEVRRKD